MNGAFNLATHEGKYVAVSDLARYMDVERRTIIRMIHAGALTAVRVGHLWRVETESARAAFHVPRETSHTISA